MDRSLAVLLTALAGGLVAMQAPINGILGRTVGSFQAAFVSFALGTLLLAAIVALATDGFGSIGEARSLPWYAFVGGALGAAYVTTVLVSIGTLGAAGVTAATITGQLSMSVVIDRYGLLGVDEQPITLARVAGVVLLGLGVFLVVRG